MPWINANLHTNPAIDMRATITVQTIAQTCGVSNRTVQRWISRDGLPAERKRVLGEGTPRYEITVVKFLDWLGKHYSLTNMTRASATEALQDVVKKWMWTHEHQHNNETDTRTLQA